MSLRFRNVVIAYILAILVGEMAVTCGLAIILGRQRVLIQSVSADRARRIRVLARPDFGYPTLSYAADIVVDCRNLSDASSKRELWISKIDLVDEGEGCFVGATWDGENCILMRRGGNPLTINTKELRIIPAIPR